MATDWLVEQRSTGLDKKVCPFQKEPPVEDLFSKAHTRQSEVISLPQKNNMIQYLTEPTYKLMSYTIEGRPSGWDTQLH